MASVDDALPRLIVRGVLAAPENCVKMDILLEGPALNIPDASKDNHLLPFAHVMVNVIGHRSPPNTDDYKTSPQLQIDYASGPGARQFSLPPHFHAASALRRPRHLQDLANNLTRPLRLQTTMTLEVVALLFKLSDQSRWDHDVEDGLRGLIGGFRTV